MNQFQVIVLATPIFFVLIGLEFAWGRWRERQGTGRVWFKPPGWQAAEVQARLPKAPFDLSSISTYDPPISKATQWAATAFFLLLLQGVSFLLWFADRLPSEQIALGSALLVVGYWCVGKLMGVRFQLF